MKNFTAYLLFVSCLVISPNSYAAAFQTQESDQPAVLAPFYTDPEYPPPEVGSYKLPPIGNAANGAIINGQGEIQRLHDLLGNGKIVLLSFFYSTCSDINGCPLATAVMYKLQQIIKTDPQLHDRFRMISLSFDPTFDTPEIISHYGTGLAQGGDWRFITTASLNDINPILESYGQSVVRDIDESGNILPSFSHVLKVFLIDPQKKIRNIYSVSFLYPELIINDAKTVLSESQTLVNNNLDNFNQFSKLSKPGDYKDGYESDTYETRSLAVEQRKGKQTDLLAYIENPPLGLPAMPQPTNNQVTRRKIALGRKLFYDRRLSLNDTFSCAMCHIPEQGFTNNELAMAIGFEGRSTRRNSPTLYNSGYLQRLFHDGREESLEQQVWGPLLARNEMANPSVGAVIKKIRSLADYRGLFEQAFDGESVNMETVSKAIASYERTLASGNSAFDRWYYGKQHDAMSARAIKGYELFTGKAGCSSCHTIGEESALFTDDQMHNTGMGYRESMGIRPDKEKILVAPGVYIEVGREVIDMVGHPPPTDVGYYEVTQNPNDRWKYHTPSLRNVALTAPYMHNGSMSNLREVVEFYNQGGVSNELLDPRIRPLGLSEQEIDYLVLFMQNLTGSNVNEIVADGFASPVGDITEDDPHWSHEKRTADK
ncbi:cytochrome c peroxidase [Candidatus Thiodiazotropha sp. CDECU1]|uniref:cytochrome c peroxidase n=1 Tax=Candidatus Thiodiazotropha sp. CDECU1 TaxID=3065865 RepID=UPI00292DEB13|nr:cytochrome c peroxidase [Candidatus Thiodiazotropha sp. CDECU1]